MSLMILEFGNYIGADLESDDEDDDLEIAPSAPAAASAPGPSAQTGGYAPLEGLEEDEDMEEDTGMEMTLHGVDG